jgi:DMSO/TMAO reductase YedYZ heme-binding membrane subunit
VIALLPPSGYDRLLGYWTAILALAYLPGRQVTLTGPLHAVLTGWKSGLSPLLLLAVAVSAFVLSWRRRA